MSFQRDFKERKTDRSWRGRRLTMEEQKAASFGMKYDLAINIFTTRFYIRNKCIVYTVCKIEK